MQNTKSMDTVVTCTEKQVSLADNELTRPEIKQEVLRLVEHMRNRSVYFPSESLVLMDDTWTSALKSHLAESEGFVSPLRNEITSLLDSTTRVVDFIYMGYCPVPDINLPSGHHQFIQSLYFPALGKSLVFSINVGHFTCDTSKQIVTSGGNVKLMYTSNGEVNL